MWCWQLCEGQRNTRIVASFWQLLFQYPLLHTSLLYLKLYTKFFLFIIYCPNDENRKTNLFRWSTFFDKNDSLSSEKVIDKWLILEMFKNEEHRARQIAMIWEQAELMQLNMIPNLYKKKDI